MCIRTVRPGGYDRMAWLIQGRCHVVTYAQAGLSVSQAAACHVGGISSESFRLGLQSIHKRREAGTFFPAVNLTVAPVALWRGPLVRRERGYEFHVPQWNFGVARDPTCLASRTDFWTTEEVDRVVDDCIAANERHVRCPVVEVCFDDDWFFKRLLQGFAKLVDPVTQVLFRNC